MEPDRETCAVLYLTELPYKFHEKAKQNRTYSKVGEIKVASL